MKPLACIGGVAILFVALIGWFVKSEQERWPTQGTFEQQA